jgi:hypothetical protein
MEEPDSSPVGRYEVAVDTLLELRRYQDFPPADRLRRLGESREPMSIWFERRRFTWHPGSEDNLPVVTVPLRDPDNFDQERFALERFLSALSYAFGYGITVYSAAASGNKTEYDPPFLQQPRLKGTIFPAPDELVVTNDQELSLCLGLIREGMSSNSKALQFLSYWKVVEVAVGETRFRDWVGRMAHELWRGEAQRSPKEWFDYLNETRIAAAHAIRESLGGFAIIQTILLSRRGYGRMLTAYGN